MSLGSWVAGGRWASSVAEEPTGRVSFSKVLLLPADRTWFGLEGPLSGFAETQTAERGLESLTSPRDTLAEPSGQALKPVLARTDVGACH